MGVHMHRLTRFVLTCLTVSCVLSLCVATAPARILSVSSRTFRGVWSPLRIRQSLSTISCNVTLEGSYAANTISKVVGTTIGRVTRATVGSPCTGGTASILQGTLPWELEYMSFTGTLPNITGIDQGLKGFAMSVDEAGIVPACLFEYRAGVVPPVILMVLLVVDVAHLLYQSYRLWRAATGPPGRRCEEVDFVAESLGTPTVLGSSTRITVRLI
jgi:hypothetical protein